MTDNDPTQSQVKPTQAQIEALMLGQTACLVALALEPLSANHDKWKKAADIIGGQIAAFSAAGEKNPSLYYRSLEAATIERCVEVIKDIPGDGGSGLIFRQDAVAAIMALKD